MATHGHREWQHCQRFASRWNLLCSTSKRSWRSAVERDARLSILGHHQCVCDTSHCLGSSELPAWRCKNRFDLGGIQGIRSSLRSSGLFNRIFSSNESTLLSLDARVNSFEQWQDSWRTQQLCSVNIHRDETTFLWIDLFFGSRPQLFETDSPDDKKTEDAFHFIAYIPSRGTNTCFLIANSDFLLAD